MFKINENPPKIDLTLTENPKMNTMIENFKDTEIERLKVELL